MVQDLDSVPSIRSLSPSEYPEMHISGKTMSFAPLFLASSMADMIRALFPAQSPTVWLIDTADTCAKVDIHPPRVRLNIAHFFKRQQTKNEIQMRQNHESSNKVSVTSRYRIIVYDLSYLS